MFCNGCGSPISNNDHFCQVCGAANTIRQNQGQMPPRPPVYQAPPPPVYQAPPPPVYHAPPVYQNPPPQPAAVPTANSFVLGLIGIILMAVSSASYGVLLIASLVLGIVGLVMHSKERVKNPKNLKAGFVMSLISVIGSAAAMIFGGLFAILYFFVIMMY